MLSLDARGSDGSRIVLAVPKSRLRKVGSKWSLTLHDIATRTTLKLKVRNRFQGRLGAADTIVAKAPKSLQG